MPTPPITSTLAGVFAALCVMALPLWIMGVPGQPDVETPYVRGWKMGLAVVGIYPIVCLLNVAALWPIGWFADAATPQQWQGISRSFGALVLLVAPVRLGWAIQILIKN